MPPYRSRYDKTTTHDFCKLSPIKTRIPLHTHKSSPLNLRPEHAADKVARKACCEVGRSEGATSEIARLAEFVTSGKGQSVDNGESQRDSYMPHISILRKKRQNNSRSSTHQQEAATKTAAV